MKFFTNKSIWTKIAIVLIFVLVFEFVVAKPSLGDSDVVEFGGKLLTPVLSLVVSLGDGLVEIMHSSIMGTSESLLEANLESAWYEIIGDIFKVILYAAATIGVFLMTGGLSGIVGAVIGYYAVTLFGDAVFDNLSSAVGLGSVTSFTEENLPGNLYLPVYSISPEEIFQGKILLFNVDFFSKGKEIKQKLNDDGELQYYYYIDEDGNEVSTSKQDIAQDLKGTISQWYVSIRNIALVVMMIVLLYIGIRMLLSTLASDKAKYRQMLQDWFMGLLILFVIHYIMAFSVTIVNRLTKVISTSVEDKAYFVNIPDDEDSKLSEFVEKSGMSDAITEVEYEGKTEKVIVWPTNLMGSLRLKTQLANWGSEYIGYALCFIVLVLFTIFFVFTYLKRVLYMAFLTLIAPVVALTYPIDKINDGSAQGFNRWFKEYIFNLLIQPMHLLLYYILITSAFNLAGSNVIYSLVAIGFMVPAEKLLRSLFGFEKAHTPGLLAGPAGAALTMGAINKLSSFGSKGSTSKNEGGSNNNSKDDGKIRIPPNNAGDDSLAEEIAKADKEIEEKQKVIDMARRTATNDEQREHVKKQQEKLDKQKEEVFRKKIQKGIQNKQEHIPENKKGGQKGRRARRRLKAIGANIKARQINGIKKMPRQVLRFAGTGAVASLGLASGLATGNPNQAFQNTLAAGTVGYSVGGRLANGVEGIFPTLGNLQDPQQAYNDVYNGREYEDLVRQENVKKFKKQYIRNLELNFGKDQAKSMVKDGGDVDQFLDEGIDDIDDIVRGKQMIDEGMINGIKEASKIAKAAKRVGKEYETTKAKEWEDTWTKEYQEKAGLSKTQARAAGKRTMDLIKDFSKGKKKIYK